MSTACPVPYIELPDLSLVEWEQLKQQLLYQRP